MMQYPVSLLLQRYHTEVAALFLQSIYPVTLEYLYSYLNSVGTELLQCTSTAVVHFLLLKFIGIIEKHEVESS